MKTLPAHSSHAARGGAPFIYLVEIAPNSTDTWTAFRWAETPVTVDGNLYQGGILAPNPISRLRSKVDLVYGGNLAAVENVTIACVDGVPLDNNPTGRRLHDVLASNAIEGREVTVYLLTLPRNRLINSSFENFSGGLPLDWTTAANDGYLAIQSDPSHGTYCLQFGIVAGSTGPQLYQTVEVHSGEDFLLSFDAKAVSGSPDVAWDIRINGSATYWNASTKAWQSGQVFNRQTVGASYARYEFHVDAADAWPPLGSTPFPHTVNLDVVLSVPDVGDQVKLDAVQFEGTARGNLASPYKPHRDELAAGDLFPRYRGQIRRPSWKLNQLKLTTHSVARTRQRDVPVTRITRNAAPVGETWDIPPDLAGEPFPMTYGDLYFRAFGTDPANPGTIWREDIGELYGVEVLPYQWKRSQAMGRLVNKFPSQREGGGAAIIYFDRPGMKLRDVGLVHHYSEEMNRYLPEIAIDNYPSASTYEWAKEPDSARAVSSSSVITYMEGQRVPLSVYLRPTRVGVSRLTGTDVLWFNTFCIAQGNAKTGGSSKKADSAMIMQNGAVGSQAVSSWQYEIYKLSDVEILEAYVIACVEIGTGAAGAAFVELRVSGTAGNQTIRILDGAGTFNNCPWACDAGGPVAVTNGETFHKFTKTDYINRFDWWNTPTDRAGTYPPQHSKSITGQQAANDDVDVYEVAVRLDLTIAIDDFRPFAAVKGREYQDTWGSRKTAGNLVENFADILESIHRDELGTAAADLDTSRFDALNTARSAWKGAGQVTQVERSEAVFEDVLFSAAAVAFVDMNGKESVRALGYQATPDRIMGPRDFDLEACQVTYVDRDDVVSDFVLHFGRNAQTGDYQNSVYANRHRSSLNDVKYVAACRATLEADLGGVENRRDFYAPWIQDPATALELLKFLVYWCKRRMVFTGGAFFDALELELADVIQLEALPGLLPSSVADTARWVLQESTVEKNNGGVDLELLEVIDSTQPDELHAWVTGVELEIGSGFSATTGQPVITETLYPDGDVAPNWDTTSSGTNYTEIDEGVGEHTDDGDYVHIKQKSVTDRYSFSDTAAGTHYVFRLKVRAQIDDPAATAQIRIRLYMGGAQYGGDQFITAAALGGFGVTGDWSWVFAPTWTQTQINSIEVEVTLV